jgi:phage shock protein A
MADNIEQKLKGYKTDVADAKTKIAQLEGSHETLLQQLSTDFGLETVEKAEKELASIQEDVVKLNTQMNNLIRKIEANYSFGK